MLGTIKKFITSVFSKTYEKPELLEELMVSRMILTDNVIDNLEACKALLKNKALSTTSKDILVSVFKNIGLKSPKDINKSISELLVFAKELEDGIPKLEKLVDSSSRDFITDKTMTAKEAGIIGTINNMTASASYLGDFTLMLTYAITDNTNMQKSFILKRAIQKSIGFKTIFSSYYSKLGKIIKDIDSLSDAQVYDSANFRISSGFKDKKFDLPVNNLIVNPIYHVRKLLVDAKVIYYDYLKYKKELIALKLKEAELKEPSPSVEKQIEYYENKLENIEYKIKKIEEATDE